MSSWGQYKPDLTDFLIYSKFEPDQTGLTHTFTWFVLYTYIVYHVVDYMYSFHTTGSNQL